MRRTIHETPSCPVRFTFWENDMPVFDEISPHGSYEYV